MLNEFVNSLNVVAELGCLLNDGVIGSSSVASTGAVGRVSASVFLVRNAFLEELRKMPVLVTTVIIASVSLIFPVVATFVDEG